MYPGKSESEISSDCVSCYNLRVDVMFTYLLNFSLQT